MSFPICRTCAVEHTARVEVCAICADERQWVPRDGQAWTSLGEMAAAGYEVRIGELEPGLHGITSTPAAGIGQQSKLLVTPAGNLLWDPIGYLDDVAVRRVREMGRVVAVAASHPHMYGVQVEWARRLGAQRVYVAEPDAEWVARPDPLIETWTGTLSPLPGVTIVQAGGHFPGSSFVHFTGADGAGVVLSSDTVYVNPDRTSVAFMRSYPNNIPLPPATVERLVAALDAFEYERIYGNFDNAIAAGARQAVHRSAARHIGWVRGELDGAAVG